jgi:hypothetical protein
MVVKINDQQSLLNPARAVAIWWSPPWRRHCLSDVSGQACFIEHELRKHETLGGCIFHKLLCQLVGFPNIGWLMIHVLISPKLQEIYRIQTHIFARSIYSGSRATAAAIDRASALVGRFRMLLRTSSSSQ